MLNISLVNAIDSLKVGIKSQYSLVHYLKLFQSIYDNFEPFFLSHGQKCISDYAFNSYESIITSLSLLPISFYCLSKFNFGRKIDNTLLKIE